MYKCDDTTCTRYCGKPGVCSEFCPGCSRSPMAEDIFLTEGTHDNYVCTYSFLSYDGMLEEESRLKEILENPETSTVSVLRYNRELAVLQHYMQEKKEAGACST